MNAFIICWATWGVVISLMAYWRRSWLELLAFPLVLSGIIWLLAKWWPPLGLWFSVLVHALLVMAIVYAAVCQRKAGDDSLLSRGKKRP